MINCKSSALHWNSFESLKANINNKNISSYQWMNCVFKKYKSRSFRFVFLKESSQKHLEETPFDRHLQSQCELCAKKGLLVTGRSGDPHLPADDIQPQPRAHHQWAPHHKTAWLSDTWLSWSAEVPIDGPVCLIITLHWACSYWIVH